jgi:tRNA nucleotidyltransferase (CCA-adding enzyme)
LRQADITGSGLPKRDDHNERFVEAVHRVLSQRPPLAVTDLAVGGREAIAALVEAGRLPAGSAGGPAVGHLLHLLLETVIEDPSRNQRDTLLALLRGWAGDDSA